MSHPAHSKNMIAASLGHVDVLSHNQDLYGPSHVRHVRTTTPAIIFFLILYLTLLKNLYFIYMGKVGSWKEIENNCINEGIKPTSTMKEVIIWTGEEAMP